MHVKLTSSREIYFIIEYEVKTKSCLSLSQGRIIILISSPV